MGVSETQSLDFRRMGGFTKLKPVPLAIPPIPRKNRNCFSDTPVAWKIDLQGPRAGQGQRHTKDRPKTGNRDATDWFCWTADLA